LKNKTFLITRPNYEPTTTYLHHWSKRLVDIAQVKGAKVLDLAADKVNRKEFEGRAKKMAPNLVHLNGHGSPHSVTGHDGEIILESANAKVLKDSVVYALSCDSGAVLGKEAIKHGVKSYIGYNQEFYFFHDNAKRHNPLQDESAAFFLEPAMKLSEELMKGKTVDEAVDVTKKAFDKSILKASSSEASTGYVSYVRYLLWDKVALTKHGKTSEAVLPLTMKSKSVPKIRPKPMSF
jgi:hypothetical protein